MKKLVLISYLALTSPAFALDVQVSEVKDSRTTGQFFAGLEIDLKLVGEDVSNVRAIRTKVATAVDSTGQNIIDPEKIETDFQTLSEFSDGKVTLKFKNPARKAESLKQLSGSIEVFVPTSDPSATVVLKNFKSISGKPVDSAALKGLGIELTMLTAKQAEEQSSKENEARVAEMRKQGMDEETIKMATAFASGFGGGGDENSVTLKSKDPNQKLIDVDFRTAAGEKISSNGSMSSSGTLTKFFSAPIPDDAQVVIMVASPKAMKTVPLQLTNVQLP